MLGHVFEARLDAVHLKFLRVKTSKFLNFFPDLNLEAEKMHRLTSKCADVGGVDD